MSLRLDYLDSVFELYTDDDFRQLVVSAQTIPAFLGGLCELEGARPDVVHRALHRRSSVDAAVRRQAFCRRRILSFDKSFVSFDKIALSLLIS